MKKRKAIAVPAEKVPTIFLRGALVTGLLAALQDRFEPGAARPGRKVLRHALQGGAALAAGSVAADALSRRDWGLALTAVAAGTVGVLAAESLLNSPMKEIHRGQEV